MLKINRSKNTKKNLVVRYLTILITAIIGFILVPLYLEYIDNELYGFWLATGYFLVLISSIDPGLTVVLQQQVAESYAKKNNKKIKELIGGGIFLVGILSLIIVGLGFTLAKYIPQIVETTNDIFAKTLILNFKIATLGTALSIFSFSISAINAGLQSSIAFLLVNLITNIFSSIISVFMLYNNYGLLSISIPLLFSGIVYILGQSTYLFWKLKKTRIGLKLSIKNLKELTQLISYTFIGRFASTATSNIDSLIIVKIINPKSVVIFSISKKIVDYVKEFINQIVVAFMPALSHYYGEVGGPGMKKIILRLIYVILSLTILSYGLIITFNRFFVELWVSEEFYFGNTINFVFATSFVFLILSISMMNILTTVANFKGNSLATFFQSLLYIPIGIFGAKYYGLLGMVAAPLISVLFTSFFYYLRKFMITFKFSKSELYDIIKAVTYKLLFIYTLYIITNSLIVKSWVFLIILIFIYSLLYFLFSYVFLKTIRFELELLFKKIKT